MGGALGLIKSPEVAELAKCLGRPPYIRGGPPWTIPSASPAPGGTGLWNLSYVQIPQIKADRRKTILSFFSMVCNLEWVRTQLKGNKKW